jgi:hypothetical protein
VRAPPQRAYIYMYPRGHPPGEHMPYASSRAHARDKLRLGYGELFTFTQCNIQHKYIYVHEHIYNVFTYCVSTCMYTDTCMYSWCAPPPHMYPREDTLKRRTCICTREDTPLSEHMPYVGTRAHAQAPTGCVTRAPKRGHPQLTSTCWGPHMHL